jgi:predicted transcriptional regulator
MSREELKEFLHQRIDEVDNDELLKKVIFWLDINTGLEEPYELTKAERQAVQEGLEDYHKGKTTSHEDFKKEVRGWRGK